MKILTYQTFVEHCRRGTTTSLLDDYARQLLTTNEGARLLYQEVEQDGSPSQLGMLDNLTDRACSHGSSAMQSIEAVRGWYTLGVGYLFTAQRNHYVERLDETGVLERGIADALGLAYTQVRVAPSVIHAQAWLRLSPEDTATLCATSRLHAAGLMTKDEAGLLGENRAGLRPTLLAQQLQGTVCLNLSSWSEVQDAISELKLWLRTERAGQVLHLDTGEGDERVTGEIRVMSVGLPWTLARTTAYTVEALVARNYASRLSTQMRDVRFTTRLDLDEQTEVTGVRFIVWKDGDTQAMGLRFKTPSFGEQLDDAIIRGLSADGARYETEEPAEDDSTIRLGNGRVMRVQWDERFSNWKL